MGLNRTQLENMYQELGINISVNTDVIKEEKLLYENYYQLEFSGGTWDFSELVFERTAHPEKKYIKKFKDEQEALKYFFIKSLYRYYSTSIFPPNNPVSKISSIEELEKLFQSMGISENYYSFFVIRPHEVYGEIINKDKISISFIDERKQKKFTTMPLDLEKGTFTMYRLTYSLYLFKTMEMEFLRKGILTEQFNDNDIELFIK